MDEIRRSVGVLQEANCKGIALLHCVSNYPPRWEDVNLLSINTLRREFNLPVGLSDHTPGSCLPVAARMLGASIIEKHITLDRSQEGLDHYFSLEPMEFAQLVDDVRHVEQAMGDGNKTWVVDEEIERYWVRRGIWVKEDIRQGEIITREKLNIVRPSHGIGADHLQDILGKKALQDIHQGEPLLSEAIE